MADQGLAPNGALKDPFASKPIQEYTLRYKLIWRWRVAQCWMRYALTGRHRGVPGLVEFVLGNHFFYAMQVRSELAALGEVLAQHRPSRALEIGTARGGTLFLLTRLANPEVTIVSIDLPGGKFGGGYGAKRKWFYQRFARRGQRLHLLQGDSHSEEMVERVKGVFREQQIDYLFIDGDHGYEGVKSDFETYGPLVRSGGLIVFHDIVEGHPDAVGGVPRLWRQVKSKYQHQEFIHDKFQGGYGIGVLFVA